VELPTAESTSRKNAFFSLLTSLVLYIPCLFNRGLDWVFGKIFLPARAGAAGMSGTAAAKAFFAGEWNNTDRASFFMLAGSAALLVGYFGYSYVLQWLYRQGGTQLVLHPVSTSQQYSLGTYQTLNGQDANDDTYDYQFGLSSWIYVDSNPQNTNASYGKWTSILNFGGKPNVLYRAKTNELMITMQSSPSTSRAKATTGAEIDEHGNTILWRQTDWALQKWNHLVVNYQGGTMDLFLNGALVKSIPGVVPYYTLDSLTIGENGGIEGNLCNMIYYPQPLNKLNIFYLYNLLKYSSPPLLSNSSVTIARKGARAVASVPVPVPVV
jgi:hypothetical protein